MPFFSPLSWRSCFFSEYLSLKYTDISNVEVLGLFIIYAELCIFLANRNIIEGIT